ncbi:MAG: beta-L-arabinofuranosidase domain-containing protein [Verrucomicrobiota bacterium]
MTCRLSSILKIAVMTGMAAFLPANAQDVPEVKPVPDALREKFHLAPFYQKHLDLGGLPILGSEKVSNYAMREAAWIVRQMLIAHPEIADSLKASGVRIVVMAYNEYTTDVPEQADWKPKDHWDRRARGMGGDISSCGEENLLCYPNDPYSTENILVHEFAHTIHGYGLKKLIPDFNERLKNAFEKAKEKGLWKNTYALTNEHEYWAEAVQDWFDNNRQNDAQHNHIHTRAQLLEYDPGVAALCREVFGDGEWRYKKPMERPAQQRSHLEGFDPTKSPAFKWRGGETTVRPPSKAVSPVVPIVARPVPISAVRLTGGPLKHAQDLNADYLLKLEPDRMLYHLRERAGLKPKASEGYGGWDGGGRQLTGHIAGHYLSAVSYMFAATGDVRFKERADYIVAELKEIQDKQGDGYIGGLMAEVRKDGQKVLVEGKQRFEDLGKGVIESGGFDLNGMWSPWYVQHKIYAGLRDAYRLTANRTALEVEVKFAEWAERILSKLDAAQIQKMLATEFGAMNEIMADLYADTGDVRWRKAFDLFEHHAIVDPLACQEDKLAGTHGNTQVPKLFGELIYHIYTGAAANGTAAKFFWDRVAHHHSFATGGHGKDEYFGEPDKLNDRVDGRTAETCNVYNMLKMARTLFSLEPDIKYAEFQERALFNHILASIDDKDGRVCYMVPVGRGVTHEYQDKFRDFTCCVGSGMESHALHGAGIYHESGDKLWVNFYTPSTVEWAAKDVRLEVSTDFPEGESVKLKIAVPSPTKLTLALRRPSWAGEGFTAKVNGEVLTDVCSPGHYLELTREWKDGDTIELILPKILRAEPVPDNPRRVALLWGPLVLAGDLGPEEARDSHSAVPVFVTHDENVANWLKPVDGKPGAFRTNGVGRDRDVDFVPFYRLHRHTYAVYWDLFTPTEWDKRAAEIATEHERQEKLKAATVAYAQPGEMQSERDFNQQGENSEPDRIMGRPARRGRTWFSFDLPVDPAHPAALVVTYYNDEWRKRTFDILVDGKRVCSQTVKKGAIPKFFDTESAIPAELIRDKRKVTVRFQATEGNEIAAVFGIRTIRSDRGSSIKK